MNRRPRVLLEALAVRRQPAGVGRAALELIRALSAQDRGLDFQVAAADPAAFAWLRGQPGWSVVPCPGARGGGVRKAITTHVQLPRLCRRGQVDLLHALQFVVPLRNPCPVVATLYDLAWRALPDVVEAPRRRYYRLVVPAGLRAATAILAVSQATASEVRLYYPDAAPKVTVIPAGTPSWVWEPDPAEAASVKNAAAPPYFLFVGTREPRKNLRGLIAAYVRFLQEAREQKRPAATIPDLVLVGRGRLAARTARCRETWLTSRRNCICGATCRERIATALPRRLGAGFPVVARRIRLADPRGDGPGHAGPDLGAGRDGRGGGRSRVAGRPRGPGESGTRTA